jgi:hypothetical protein
MQGTANLDALLNGAEPHATFHDAELLSIAIDYQAGTLVAEWRLCVGDPSAPKPTRERTRGGKLMLQGLTFWVAEPPSEASAGTPWLTADGPLAESPTTAGRELARLVPPGGVGWYLYFSDSNAFAYVGASSARFMWA